MSNIELSEENINKIIRFINNMIKFGRFSNQGIRSVCYTFDKRWVFSLIDVVANTADVVSNVYNTADADVTMLRDKYWAMFGSELVDFKCICRPYFDFD